MCVGDTMDYKEWESLKTGVKRFFEEKGTIVASCVVGHAVKFDNGITKRITDGILYRIKS